MNYVYMYDNSLTRIFSIICNDIIKSKYFEIFNLNKIKKDKINLDVFLRNAIFNRRGTVIAISRNT